MTGDAEVTELLPVSRQTRCYRVRWWLEIMMAASSGQGLIRSGNPGVGGN